MSHDSRVVAACVHGTVRGLCFAAASQECMLPPACNLPRQCCIGHVVTVVCFCVCSRVCGACTAQGQYELAIQDYTTAIRLHPSHCRAYYNRAFCHDRLNHVEQVGFRA